MSSAEDVWNASSSETAKSHQHRTEVRDGMRIEWDVPIRISRFIGIDPHEKRRGDHHPGPI